VRGQRPGPARPGGIVSEDRPDLPDGEVCRRPAGRPDEARSACDAMSLTVGTAGARRAGFSQVIPSGDAAIDVTAPSTSGVLGTITWAPASPCCYAATHRRSAQRRDDRAFLVPPGRWHSHRACTPTRGSATAGVELSLSCVVPCRDCACRRTRRRRPHVRPDLCCRGPGPEFSEARVGRGSRCWAPHLDLAYLDAGRRRHPVPPAHPPPRQGNLAAPGGRRGVTQLQIARRLGISQATVRTHLENI
jgi:hypothetical protein